MSISVIMLTYNRRTMMEEAVKSILKQTFDDFEFIIINNGSTDDSQEVIEEYMKKDKRIKLINIEKSNIAVARNIGLEYAQGEYITFIDDDDIAKEDMLEFLYELVKKEEADMAFCGSYKKIGDKIEDNCIFKERLVFTPEEAVIELLKRKKCNAAMPTKIIKKEIMKNIGFNEDSVHEDIFTTYKLMAHANKVVGHGLPKYYFTRHGQNISAFTSNDKLLTPEQLEEYFRAFRERTEYISRILPSISDYARYSEWSYMISMCNKIETNQLENCAQQLAFIKKELKTHYNEFYNCPFIEPFEREYMKRYIND